MAAEKFGKFGSRSLVFLHLTTIESILHVVGDDCNSGSVHVYVSRYV